MVTLEPLLFVSVSGILWLSPTWTFGKLRLGGLAESEPGGKPAPETGKFSGELTASLTMATLPLTVPLAWGANTTLKLVLWPAASVTGSDNPLKVNPAPVTVACEIVVLEVPTLVRVAGSV